MICLGVSAIERSSKCVHMTFSPDTDVTVLVIANYDRLPNNIPISMTSGVQQIEPLWTALGSVRAQALPGLHVSSCTDNTGRFLGVGKKNWF